MKELGKKVINIDELVDVFEAQEGELQSYSGGIGQGKTYGATRRAINDLMKGRVVYTNWHLILDDFCGDERKSLRHLFWRSLFFRKRFYNIDIKKNWHYFDMEDESTWFIEYKERVSSVNPTGRVYFDDLIDFIANITDATVYLDEGQDIFDSYEGTKMSKKKRKSITRTRHLRKTLVVISQRPQAIAVTARANVNVFYKHVKTMSWPFVHFKVYATEDIDAQNMPTWDLDNMKPVETYFANKRILNAYNSWYLRHGIPRSQEVFFEAYDLDFKERLDSIFSVIRSRLKPRTNAEILQEKIESLGDNAKNATIKIDTGSKVEALVREKRTGSIQRTDGGIPSPYIDQELPF